MSTTEADNATRLDALHARMTENSLAGHWQNREKRPELVPWRWPWDVVRDCLTESGEVMPIGHAGEANNRRTVQLINPNLMGVKATSRTLQMSVQLVKPGETAESHRHTAGALRFIVESTGAYTTVEGEQMVMEPGDLVLTPNWTWHDHTNDTATDTVWLDVLDIHISGHLDAIVHELFPEGAMQPITKPDGYSRARYGAVRPSELGIENPALLPYTYKWADAKAALLRMSDLGETSPYDGVILEYKNPVTGGPTMPTIGCWVQMLRPGESTQSHKHTCSTIFHSISGQGDCFFVPTDAPHQHTNTSKAEPAFLFSVTDRPILEALHLYREES
jgi:gentisate 1,2-dioxygenase